MHIGSRIVIYGPIAAGKSTLATRLGSLLGLPVIELDAFLHAKPGWAPSTRYEYQSGVEGAIARAADGWIVEGNDTSVEDLALPLADTIIWLRLPFSVSYPLLVRRTLRNARTHALLWSGNRATWRSVCGRRSLLAWGIYDWRPNKRRTKTRLRNRPPGTKVFIFRSQGEVDRFVATLEASQAADRGCCRGRK